MLTATKPLSARALKMRANKIDKTIERIYYDNCQRVEVSVLDIGKIFAAGRAVADEGDEAIKVAVLAKVAEVRKN